MITINILFIMVLLPIPILNHIFDLLEIIYVKSFLITSQQNFLKIKEINIFDKFIVGNQYYFNFNNIYFFIHI